MLLMHVHMLMMFVLLLVPCCCCSSSCLLSYSTRWRAARPRAPRPRLIAATWHGTQTLLAPSSGSPSGPFASAAHAVWKQSSASSRAARAGQYQ